MKWEEVRVIYPNQFVKFKVLDIDWVEPIGKEVW